MAHGTDADVLKNQSLGQHVFSWVNKIEWLGEHLFNVVSKFESLNSEPILFILS